MGGYGGLNRCRAILKTFMPAVEGAVSVMYRGQGALARYPANVRMPSDPPDVPGVPMAVWHLTHSRGKGQYQL